MFSWWKCKYCDLLNLEDNNQCQACFNLKIQLSPIEHIMAEQQLLFDGFLRMEILNNLTNNFSKILCDDVINLCHTFYKLEIKPLMSDIVDELISENEEKYLSLTLDFNQQKAEIFTLLCLTDQFTENKEFFIAFQIIHMLIVSDLKMVDIIIA